MKTDFPAKESAILVSFEVHGFDVDPDEISRMLQLKPTFVERKGAKSGKSAIVAKANSWTIESDLEDEFDADEHIQELIGKLKNFGQLNKLKGMWNGQFNCAVSIVGDDKRPYLGLSPSTMKSMGEMGCGFDVEYFVSK